MWRYINIYSNSRRYREKNKWFPEWKREKKKRQQDGKGKEEQNGEVGGRARLRGREMREQKRKGRWGEDCLNPKAIN